MKKINSAGAPRRLAFLTKLLLGGTAIASAIVTPAGAGRANR